MSQKVSLKRSLEMLESRIESLPDEKRHLLQEDLHMLVERMLEAGLELPKRVRLLDDFLMEERIEAQFDNMPV